MSIDQEARLLFQIDPGAVSVLAREEGASYDKSEPDITIILVPGPGQNWWAGSWFAPPADQRGSALAQLAAHRSAFAAWQADAGKNLLWRWRARRSSATGLPGYVRGWLARPLDDTNAIDQAEEWLRSQLIPLQLLGRDDLKTFFPFWEEPVTLPPDRWETGGSDWELVHLHAPQLWNEQFRVLGSHLSIHLARGDVRASATSSYLPLDPARTFDQAIAQEKAIELARKALAHYADPRGGYEPERALELLGQGAASLARYGEQQLAILPFAGDFRLIYNVQLSTPDQLQQWSVLVDAERGVVLGRPEAQQYHALVYASSQDCLDAARAAEEYPPRPYPLTEQVHLGGVSPVNGTFEVLGQQQLLWDDAALPSVNAQQQEQFEANNVGVHARRMLNYLRELTGIAAGAPWPNPDGRTMRIALGHKGNGTLYTYFLVPNQNEPARIFFQADTINPKTRPIYFPARDPELIYHEVAHALTWALNPEPFDHSLSVAPFARALVEGLATLLARSLGGRPGIQSTPDQRFAVAAYRETDWTDHWALSRSSHNAGSDYLPLPHLYPNDLAAGASGSNIGYYEVGMVCARALWSLRPFVDAKAVDRATLDSYRNHVRGRVTSFESLAEGLFEHAERDGWDGPLAPLLAARGILAEQGVQALVADSLGVVVAGDAGVQRKDGGPWSPWGDADNGTTLQDTVALAAYEPGGQPPIHCAATELGIFTRPATGGPWSTVVANLGVPPLSLTAEAAGTIYVGTGSDVRVIQPGGATTTLPGPQLMALDLTISRPGTTNQTLCTAAFSGVWVRRLNPVFSSWTMVDNASTAMVTCVLAVPNTDRVYIGTAHAGIWLGTRRHNGMHNPRPVRIGTYAELGPVLCLARMGSRVFAGTSGGVFVGSLVRGTWRWGLLASPAAPHQSLPQGAVITALAATSSTLYAGTATHGLWSLALSGVTNPAALSWTKEPVNVASASPVPEVAAPAVLAVPTLPPLTASVALPYYLTSSGTMSCVLGQNRPLELWRLERGTLRVGSGVNGQLTVNNQPPGYYLLLIGRV